MRRRLLFLWYETTYLFAHMAFLLGLRLRTEGRGNIPSRGPVLVVANHQSFLDPVLVGLATRRHLRAVARKSLLRNWVVAALIRSLETIPIDHRGVGKEGLKVVLDELQRGKGILIFPEGTRTPDGRLHELRPGIHLLLRRAAVPIVPVGIAGAYDVWPTWRAYPTLTPLFLPGRRPGVALAVGRPLDGKAFARLSREEALAELGRHLQRMTDRAEHLRRWS